MADVKKIRKLVLDICMLLLITATVCSGMFGESIYKAYDLTFHLNRLAGIKDALLEHQFLPKIYPYTNNGYGYASPLFYCDLYLYPFAILYYLGLPLVVTYKTMIFFYVFITAAMMLFFTERATHNSYVSYVTTCVYMSCSYYLFDIYARAALGEIFAFCFIPLVIYASYKLFIKKTQNWFLTGVAFSLLLKSHLISFILYCGVFGLYTLYFILANRKDKELILKTLFTILKAVIYALLVNAWYVLPMIEQLVSQEFWINELGSLYDVADTSQSIKSLIYPFVHLDNVVDNYGAEGIFTILGNGILLLFLPFIYLTIRKSKNIEIVILVITFCLLLVYGVVPVVSELNFLQFLYRLNIVIYPLTIITVIYCFDKLKTKYIKALAILCIAYLFVNAFSIDCDISKSDNVIFNYETREKIFDISKASRDYNEIELSGAEYLPVTLNTDYLEESTSIKQVNSDGYEDLIYDYDRNFTEISFAYDSPEEKLIMLPQSYYKGYQAYIVNDNKKIKLDTFSVPEYSQVGFYLMKGNNTYVCSYEGTMVQDVSLAVSSLTMLYAAYLATKHVFSSVKCK